MASFYREYLQASPSGTYELLWLFVHNFFCLITNVLLRSVFSSLRVLIPERILSEK